MCFVIHFLIFKRRTISAITMDSPGVVICINVFEYELICMIVIANLKSVQPFSFNQCMERLDTGVIPRISFSGVALFNSLCCSIIFIGGILNTSVCMDYFWNLVSGVKFCLLYGIYDMDGLQSSGKLSRNDST